MSFNFGNVSQPAFGTSPAKPTGFATPFGSTAPTSSAGFSFGTNSFGQTQPAPAFGSTFGATNTSGAFGATSFGAPVSGTSTFGSTFGTPASTSSVFGTGFGAQPQGSGLFGAAASKPGVFGAPATSTPSIFGTGTTVTPNLFGAPQSTQATPSLFGNTLTTTPSLFGSGTSTTPSMFGSSFGQPSATTTPSLFGTSTNVAPFGSGGLFGTTTSAPSLFGSSAFGTTTTSTTAGGFGSFGTGASSFGGFTSSTGQTSIFGPKPLTGLQSQQQGVVDKNQLVVASVYAINVFNDERDDVLKKWNMLQACWGSGKGYYNSTQPPVEYVPQNPFYRFKAIGYNAIPEQDNSEGIVRLVFNKKITELRSQQDSLKTGLLGVLGNRPNLSVEIILIKAVSSDQTEVKISVSEKGVTGNCRRIPATDLAAFLIQPSQKQQLTNVGVTSISPYVTPTKAELEEYLKQTPPGIDQQMWQAAIQDNPNPRKYIPVPINGFSDLRARMLHQEYQTGLHQAFLDKVNREITELKTKHAASVAHIAELKQKYLDLQHRILRVLVKQESIRKVGIAIQPAEELLRGRLEVMHAQLNLPKQFKGQINELLSHVKMIETTQKQSEQKYRLDAEAQDEIKQFLKMEQHGISQLISIINNDMQALKLITEGLKEMEQQRPIRKFT
ncbi:nucleoporin p54 [Cylas formicarius]|uniref:nucleoporin p54 n=1 Tax=Cylas formicarius TaxID=197179 RepID=UPI002958C5AD|nr:nucleoporin p54 [Cylas formicarius]